MTDELLDAIVSVVAPGEEGRARHHWLLPGQGDFAMVRPIDCVGIATSFAVRGELEPIWCLPR